MKKLKTQADVLRAERAFTLRRRKAENFYSRPFAKGRLPSEESAYSCQVPECEGRTKDLICSDCWHSLTTEERLMITGRTSRPTPGSSITPRRWSKEVLELLKTTILRNKKAREESSTTHQPAPEAQPSPWLDGPVLL